MSSITTRHIGQQKNELDDDDENDVFPTTHSREKFFISTAISFFYQLHKSIIEESMPG
jgi:hypothetical protein